MASPGVPAPGHLAQVLRLKDLGIIQKDEAAHPLVRIAAEPARQRQPGPVAPQARTQAQQLRPGETRAGPLGARAELDVLQQPLHLRGREIDAVGREQRAHGRFGALVRGREEVVEPRPTGQRGLDAVPPGLPGAALEDVDGLRARLRILRFEAAPEGVLAGGMELDELLDGRRPARGVVDVQLAEEGVDILRHQGQDEKHRVSIAPS